MRALGACFLATTNPLLTKTDIRTGGRFERESPILEACPGQDEEAPQIMLIHLPNSLEDVPVDRHRLSALAGGAGDVRGEATVALARTSGEGALDRAFEDSARGVCGGPEPGEHCRSGH